METKPLLYGLIGFFIGGLLVSIAATTFDKNVATTTQHSSSKMMNMSMQDMSHTLKDKTGDDYDAGFITSMIAHHEGAVEMAKLSAQNAKHDEIKKLSEAIIAAQEKEIIQMKQWQKDWGYSTTESTEHKAH